MGIPRTAQRTGKQDGEGFSRLAGFLWRARDRRRNSCSDRWPIGGVGKALRFRIRNLVEFSQSSCRLGRFTRGPESKGSLGPFVGAGFRTGFVKSAYIA